MIELFKYAGLSLLVLAALALGKRYSAYTERRLAELDGFLRFARHVRGRVASFLEPIPRAAATFRDDALDALGFTRKVSRGESLSEAYREVETASAVSGDGRELLGEFFDGFGKGSREESLSFADRYIGELTELLSRERTELEKSVKLTKTLLAAAALGIVILFI